MEIFNRLNMHPTNWDSCGISGDISTRKEQILAAIPDTIYGNALISIVMHEMPNIKNQDRIKNECKKLYRRLRQRNAVKELCSTDLNRIVQIAIKSVKLNKPIPYRKLADKLCEKHSTCYYNHYPVYQQFKYMIDDGLSRTYRKTIINLQSEQN